MALYHPWSFFEKSYACESSKRFVNPCNLTKKEQKLPWLQKTGLLKLDSQNFQTMHIKLFCSQTKRFARKNVNNQEKMQVAILSKVY
jgi:hypothetical protein